jgi:glycosyltransferase 2 family protein
VGQYIKLAVAALLIFWLTQSDQLDFSIIGASFFSLDQSLVAAMLLLGFAVQIARWTILLRIQGIPIALRDSSRIFWIGQFFFMTSLGAAGGEAARGYYISRYAGDKTVAAISTVFVDRLLGLYTFTLLGSLAFLSRLWQGEAPHGVQQMGWAALLLFAAISLFFLFIYNRRLREWFIGWLPELWQSRLVSFFNLDRRKIRQLPSLFFLSLLANLTLVIAYKLACDILYTPISWQDILLITPLVVIANSLPISFGGLGVGEAAAQALMAQVGLGNGASIVLLIRVTQWILALPIGAYFYLKEGKKLPLHSVIRKSQ